MVCYIIYLPFTNCIYYNYLTCKVFAIYNFYFLNVIVLFSFWLAAFFGLKHLNFNCLIILKNQTLFTKTLKINIAVWKHIRAELTVKIHLLFYITALATSIKSIEKEKSRIAEFTTIIRLVKVCFTV